MEAKNNDTVLAAIADDHDLVREGIVAQIEALGDVKFVVSVGDGKKLIEGIAAAPQMPEISIVDIQMPRMDGLVTIEQIKKRWPGMKILVLSSFKDDLTVMRAIQLGVDGYLSKNHSFQVLMDALQHIQKGGVYFTDNKGISNTAIFLQSAEDIPELTAKEIELLGYADRESPWGIIAQEMGTTQKSVEGYRDGLYRKLGVKSKVGLLLYAIRLGLIRVESAGAPLI